MHFVTLFTEHPDALSIDVKFYRHYIVYYWTPPSTNYDVLGSIPIFPET